VSSPCSSSVRKKYVFYMYFLHSVGRLVFAQLLLINCCSPIAPIDFMLVQIERKFIHLWKYELS
jgi:hypothetical protein